MDDLRLSDSGKARLFRNAMSREQAGLLPICDAETDPRNAPALQGAELRAFWERIWERESITIGNTADDRKLAAWRLTRQLAVIRGVIQPGDPLEWAGHDIVWTDTEFTSYVEVRDAWLRRLLASGVSMAPPEVPSTHLLPSGAVDEDYRPERDEELTKFVDLVTYVGQGILALEQSAKTRRGFAWFTSVDTVRVAWPSVPVLSQFEAEVAAQAADLLVEHEAKQARDEIRARWDLSHSEVEQVYALALKAMAVRQRFEDRDGNKALILARMDALREKAIDALDHRGAAMIDRERWRIFRDRGEEDVVDEFEDMTNVISVSASEKRKALPKPKDTQR